MSGWLRVCGRTYRAVARAYPRNFRIVCGDGLEQLGDDLVPLVWRSVPKAQLKGRRNQ